MLRPRVAFPRELPLACVGRIRPAVHRLLESRHLRSSAFERVTVVYSATRQTMNAPLSYKDAAREVLVEAGEALHAHEIARRAIQIGLVVTTGKTPQATMEAALCVAARAVHRLQIAKIGEVERYASPPQTKVAARSRSVRRSGLSSRARRGAAAGDET